MGASGGSIVIWKSCSFRGTRVFQNNYAASFEFFSLHNGAAWFLTNVYAPCTPVGKRDFRLWFRNIQMLDTVDWLIVGDFNLYRNPEDRNKPGADYAKMLLFNDAISYLGLIELPLKGRRYMWTNKQHPPSLSAWTGFSHLLIGQSRTQTLVSLRLSMETSDHVPCLVSIDTSIPKGHVFCFEIFWLDHEDFMAHVQGGWLQAHLHSDATKNLTAKFKYLRKVLKSWSRTLSSLKDNIARVKLVLGMLNFLEEFRDLSLVEWNFRVILEKKLVTLLNQQEAYWQQRGKIKWVTLGDATTNFLCKCYC